MHKSQIQCANTADTPSQKEQQLLLGTEAHVVSVLDTQGRGEKKPQMRERLMRMARNKHVGHFLDC